MNVTTQPHLEPKESRTSFRWNFYADTVVPPQDQE